jgi:hypothetical protein
MTSKQTDRQAGSRGATCRTSGGRPCGGIPVTGTSPPVCARHLPNPKARANAAVRAELAAWRVDDDTADPGMVLLRLLTQAANRAALYGLLLEQQYQALHDNEDADAAPVPRPVAALIGHRYTVSKGRRWPVGEAIRGLVQLEAEERDRAARFAKLALDAGVSERLVRVEEQKALLLFQALRAILVELGLDPRDERVTEVVTRHLRALEQDAA